jgi:hypothetical protein
MPTKLVEQAKTPQRTAAKPHGQGDCAAQNRLPLVTRRRSAASIERDDHGVTRRWRALDCRTFKSLDQLDPEWGAPLAPGRSGISARWCHGSSPATS